MPTTKIIFDYTEKVSNKVAIDGIIAALMAGGQVVEGEAKINTEKTFSGKSLGGAGLGGSIHTIVVDQSRNHAKVHVGPSVVYGRIQELGGTIYPLNAKKLSWVDDSGVRIFAGSVHLPARPYLRPALEQNLQKVKLAITVQLQKSIEEAIP